MAEKIEIEKPVVSEELAEAFEDLKKMILKSDDGKPLFQLFNSDNYQKRFYQATNKFGDDFDALLARMYVLGYEVEKPKRYVLELPVLDQDNTLLFLCNDNSRVYYRWIDQDVISSSYFHYSNGFTKAEIEADEGLNKLAGVCELVEVED